MKTTTKPGWLEAARAEASPDGERLWRALEEVLDPEWPISVVDMGLIYGLRWQNGQVELQLTFTAMGCPALEMIIGDVRDRLLHEKGVESVAVEIVWDPPWTRERLSERGREKLKTWGISA
jgi:metal-sulfur cluster biosynthetic enzyme